MRRGIFILLILFAGTIAFRLYSWKFVLPPPDAKDFGFRWYQNIYYPSYTRLDGLLTGIAIAALHQFLPGFRNGLRRYGNLLIVAGLLMLGLAWIVCADEMSYRASIYGFTLIAIAYGVILSGAISPASILYRFSSKVTSFIAAFSYAIYLCHKGVIHLAQPFFEKLGIDPDSSLMFLFCAISCLLSAILLRYAIEKPFLKLRDRILEKKKAQKKVLITDK